MERGQRKNMEIAHIYLASTLYRALGQVLRSLKSISEMIFSRDFNIQIVLVRLHLAPENSIIK